MPKIFRQEPPSDVIELFVKGFGLSSLQDATWFSKSCIHLTVLEDSIPVLEPYYIPCKAKEYLHPPLTNTRAITILRQLLGAKGASLISKEKSCGGSKVAYYQISWPQTPSGREIQVDFS